MGMQRMSDAEVEQEFAGGIAGIHHYLPGYSVQTLALPYGVFPRHRKLVIQGQSGGVYYHHVCAMDAGWYPAPSPLSKAFRPYAVPRIIPGDAHTRPGSVDTIRYWLAYLEAHKGEKFVSDGDPNTYTVAASKMALLDQAKLRKEGFRLRDYTGTHLAAVPGIPQG